MSSASPTSDAQGISISDNDLQHLSVPKYKRLELYLVQQIRDGAFAPTGQLPTEKELMAQFNYSYTTVNRALQAMVKSGLITRKRGHGTFVSRQTAPPTRRAGGMRTNTLALFHGGLRAEFHPYYSVLMEGFVEAAGRHGLAMMIMSVQNGEVNIDAEFLERHGVDGCVVGHTRASDLRAAVELGIPLVSLSGNFRDINLDRVVQDGAAALRMAGAYLRDLGYERLMILDHRPKSDVREPLAEVFDCLPKEVPVDDIHVNGFDTAAGREAVQLWRGLPQRPAACFVRDDILAMNFLRALEQDGVKVPGDLSVMTSGTPYSASFMGAAATMTQFDPRQIGSVAVDLLVKRIADPSRRTEYVSLQPELVVRETTAARA